MTSQKPPSAADSSHPRGAKELADVAELQQARALWGANRINESLRYFDRAVRLYPNNPTALIEAATAFGNRFEIGRAEELLSRLRLNFSDPRILMATGLCYQTISRWNEAIECYDEVLAVSPDHFEAHLALSRAHDRINQLDQGLEHAAQCLALQPNSPDALLIDSQLSRRIGETNRAEIALRRLITDGNTPVAVRISSHYQLGYLLDDDGRYEEAFGSVLKAKEIQIAEGAELLLKSAHELTALEDLWLVNQADVERWTRETAGFQRERIAFVLGAPRSGTTLLERILRAHPAINSTDEEFFLPQDILPELMNNRDNRKLHLGDLHQLTKGRLKIDRERYFRFLTALLRENSRSKLHIDKNPSLIRLLPALLRLFPEAKILFAVRDPRDIVVSCFMRQFPLNSISTEFLTLEGTVKSVSRDLELWQKLKHSIPGQWSEIRYEAMVADTESTAKQLLQFLEVTWDPTVLNFHESTSVTNSPSYEAVSKPIFQHARGRWSNYEKFLAPHGQTLELLSKLMNYR